MTAVVVAPVVLDGLKFALSEVEIIGTKAAQADALEPRFERFHSTGSSSLIDIDASDFKDYMIDCDEEIKPLLKKLRWAKSGGKEHGHEIDFNKKAGMCWSNLVVVTKRDGVIGILTCRSKIDFDVHVPGLIWKLPFLAKYASLPLKEKALYGILEQKLRMELKILGNKELGM